jgi:hypothetical protein
MAAGALAVLGLWETSGPASAAGEAPEHLPSHVEDWNTNWDRSLIDPESLSAGGPHRDGIPSIDQPRFIGVQQASEWLAPSEPVIALEIDGEARAYPLQILVWHEIVNDHVAGVPAVVTYCPLCNAALAFDARVQGRPLSFGTSGLLRNSDLVMYDRTTETLWQQFTGRAIVGDLAGEWLEPIATQLIGFGQYAAEYPHGGVLSRETGYNRKYGRTPYPGYDRPTTSSSPLGVLRDRRLRPMQRVLSFTLVEETEEMIREVSAAIPLQALAAQGALNFTVAGEDLVALHAPGAASALDEREIAEGRDVGGTGLFSARVGDRTLTFVADGPLFRDEETGTRWTISGRAVDGSLAGTELDSVPHYDTFWFVWVAFQPDTMLWGAH